MPSMLGRSWYSEREAGKHKEVVTKSGHQMRTAQSLCHEGDGPDPVGRCSGAELLTVGTHSFAGLEMHFSINNKMFSASFRCSQISSRRTSNFSPNCSPGYLVACIGLHVVWGSKLTGEPHGSLRVPVYTTWHDRARSSSKPRPPNDRSDRPGPFYFVFSLCILYGSSMGTNSRVPLGTTAPFSVFTRCRPNRVSRSAPRAPRSRRPIGPALETGVHESCSQPRERAVWAASPRQNDRGGGEAVG